MNLIGHSLGSVISIQEAGTYNDVSRVVVTGLLHVPGVGVGFATTLARCCTPPPSTRSSSCSGLDRAT